MDTFDKIAGWFQIVASAFFTLFALFNMIRTFIQHPETFYFMCFSTMLFLAWKMTQLSIRELKDAKKGDKK